MPKWMKGQPPQDPPAGEDKRSWTLTVEGRDTVEEAVSVRPDDVIDLWDEAGRSLFRSETVTLEEVVDGVRNRKGNR